MTLALRDLFGAGQERKRRTDGSLEWTSRDPVVVILHNRRHKVTFLVINYDGADRPVWQAVIIECCRIHRNFEELLRIIWRDPSYACLIYTL